MFHCLLLRIDIAICAARVDRQVVNHHVLHFPRARSLMNMTIALQNFETNIYPIKL